MVGQRRRHFGTYLCLIRLHDDVGTPLVRLAREYQHEFNELRRSQPKRGRVGVYPRPLAGREVQSHAPPN